MTRRLLHGAGVRENRFVPRANVARRLVVVLGDQLDPRSAAFDGFDRGRDVVLMAEAEAEARRVPSHRARIALFLSAMRHFRQLLEARGIRVRYRALDDPETTGTLGGELEAAIRALRPRDVVLVEPGEWGVLDELERVARGLGTPLAVLPDRHFLCSREEFAAHAAGRRQLRMEYFYREMRRRYGVLMEGGEPAGGRFNYDDENRAAFGRRGPGPVPVPIRFLPDATTREVLTLVARRFPDHPGELERFDWPVTPVDARAALDDFVQRRLPLFGRFQDAMWTGQPWLYHSRISAALNLKLLDPREAIAEAERAWRDGCAPLAAAEGFIRQILGWREFVRGIYWLFMPGYLTRNALGATQPLPAFYWTGETEMRCLAEVIGTTLRDAYSHHIQRLMVTGLFALLLGVDPREVHTWYLAMYVDAVEWVELPNTLGMSQFADGGVIASKPYVASGRYIDRMSNFCRECRYAPGEAVGDDACPFTSLYWDFLARHRAQLAKNPRMAQQHRNLARIPAASLRAIRARARRLQTQLAGPPEAPP